MTRTLDTQRSSFAHAIAERGWAVTPPILDGGTVQTLRAEVAPLAVDGRGGARNLLDNTRVRALAASTAVREFASAVLGDRCFAVRALLFDKTSAANWKVVWHQDLTIPTRARADVPGYGPWTHKAGVPHVQPPTDVLEQMLAIRLHLDPCGAENGPVRVLEGSHRLGRLSAAAIDELRRRQDEIDCLVDEGGILAFRPLILHASAPARAPGHRRVLHIEFAACELAPPLEWHWRVT
jgi:ectoine hydroxylase-related dioxygenase (phytanoyl-CoA dioxygenase family)